MGRSRGRLLGRCGGRGSHNRWRGMILTQRGSREAPPILERDFQRTVIELAEVCGWRSYHVANVKGRLRAKSSIGFPDLVLVRSGRVIAAELKRDGRDLTDPQRAWLDALDLVPGIEAVCWRRRLARNRGGPVTGAARGHPGGIGSSRRPDCGPARAGTLRAGPSPRRIMPGRASARSGGVHRRWITFLQYILQYAIRT